MRSSDLGRHLLVRKAGPPVGNADFANINVAFGVERDAMRSEELSTFNPGPLLAAKPRDARSFVIDDGQARTEIGHLAVDRHARAEFADDEIRMLAAAAQKRAGPVQVVPLRLVFAIAVEYLDAVVLAINNIDEAIRVCGDVVHDIELAVICPRLAPAPDQLAVGSEFVHAGIAVAVRDVNLALRRQRRVRAAMERLAAHEWRGLVRDADGEQHFAVG